MSSYQINDLGISYPKTYSFLPNQEKDENDIMSQSCLVVPPYRRIRHAELTPVEPREPSYKTHANVKVRQQQQSTNNQSFNQLKPPKRAFSMTRLDQLARPRQRYLVEALKLRASKTKENLCYSAVRPTSSMSLASKQQAPNNNTFAFTLRSANHHHSHHHHQNNNNNNQDHTLNVNSNNIDLNSSNGSSGTGLSTILLRQRTNTRKQRPISYAGYTSITNNNNNNSSLNQDHHNTTFTRSSTKAKSPFNTSSNHNRTFNSSTFNSSSSQTRNLMVSSMDGSMLSSLSKPTPPRKPSHHITVSARKIAKQQQQQEMTNLIVPSSSSSTSSSKRDHHHIKKSDSTPRISSSHTMIVDKNVTNPTKDRMMKKSITNPERIAELLDEKLNLNNDNDDDLNKQLSNVKSTTNRKPTTTLDDESDKINLTNYSNQEQQSNQTNELASDLLLVKATIVDKSTTDDNQLHPFKSTTSELDNMSNNTYILDNANDKSSTTQLNQLIDLTDEDAVRLSNERANELSLDELMRNEEQLQETRRLENEEMKFRAQEEEKKRLAREEKERELERKNKEKAEKARPEMEERLRKDEQERIERKKRLDAIMSRTRKNPTLSSTKSAEHQSNKTDDLNSSSSGGGTDKKSSPINPDVVEDAIIKLTEMKNDNNLTNNSINNGKSELHNNSNYIENETIIESKNLTLINGFKEMKMSSNSTFVFSQTSNTPGAN